MDQDLVELLNSIGLPASIVISTQLVFGALKKNFQKVCEDTRDLKADLHKATVALAKISEEGVKISAKDL